MVLPLLKIPEPPGPPLAFCSTKSAVDRAAPAVGRVHLRPETDLNSASRAADNGIVDVRFGHRGDLADRLSSSWIQGWKGGSDTLSTNFPRMKLQLLRENRRAV